MDKLDMRFPLSEEQQRLKQEAYDRLVKNEHVQAWLAKYELPNSFLMDHTGKFQDWLKQVEKCDGCKGLSFCRQTIKGQYMDLYMDTFLNVGIHRCSYYRDFEDEMRHGKYYLEMNMPMSQMRIDLFTIDVDKESNAYAATVDRVITLMMDKTVKKGLYLWGKPGVGKSYLAAGITNYYTRQKIRCAFVNVPKLIGDLKMMFHDNDAMEAKLKAIRNVPVLVLDDIGGESVTAWSRDDILLPLLDYRMENQKLTFFTSNYSMKDLKERLSVTSNRMREPMAAERLIERIRTLSSEEFVKGESRRK